MCKLGVIPQERLKIEVKLQLSADRNLVMYAVSIAQQRMTLSDLEWRTMCLLYVVVLGNYWSNSQYRVQLKVPDRSVFDRRTFLPDSDKCSLVVSLMQKDSRRNRTLYSGRRTEVAMTFDLYKVYNA